MNACPRLGDKAIGSWKLAGLVRNLGSVAEWNLRDHGVAGTTLFVYKLVVIILITLACNENLPRSHIFLIPIPVPYSLQALPLPDPHTHTHTHTHTVSLALQLNLHRLPRRFIKFCTE
jgi:hypothetical protein